MLCPQRFICNDVSALNYIENRQNSSFLLNASSGTEGHRRFRSSEELEVGGKAGERRVCELWEVLTAAVILSWNQTGTTAVHPLTQWPLWKSDPSQRANAEPASPPSPCTFLEQGILCWWRMLLEWVKLKDRQKRGCIFGRRCFVTPSVEYTITLPQNVILFTSSHDRTPQAEEKKVTTHIHSM